MSAVSEEVRRRAQAGVLPPPSTDAFRVDYTWYPKPPPPGVRKTNTFPIFCTAASHGDLLTGASARMTRSYKNVLPAIQDCVMRLETTAHGRGGFQAQKTIVIPLEDAVRYFGASPSDLAELLSLSRDNLVADWNQQPAGEKFPLEWQEDICQYSWHQDEEEGAAAEKSATGEEEPSSSAVVLSLTTFGFTDNHKMGQVLSPSDVQLNIKLKSTALYQNEYKTPARGFVDHKGRRSDKHGFSCPSQHFLDILRDPQFEQQLMLPARRFVEQELPGRRLQQQREAEAAAAVDRRRNKRPRVNIAELGRQYRVVPATTTTTAVGVTMGGDYDATAALYHQIDLPQVE